MELKRVLAKDSRTAFETINENYGENTVIVESNKVQGKVGNDCCGRHQHRKGSCIKNVFKG